MKKILHLIALFIVFHLTSSTIFAQGVDLGREYPFGRITSLAEGIGYLIGPTFAIAGTAVLIYFIWGAAKIVFSQGDKNEVAAARQMITHAIIGFVLLILMFVIFQFLPQFLGFNFRVIQLPGR